MSEFRKRVYAIAAKIPKGKVMTYGQLAAKAGNPRAARAVGMCMKQNPDTKKVPCHRVVASNGAMIGYSAGRGIATKRKKLIEEGVQFRGGRVDLTRSLWRA